MARPPSMRLSGSKAFKKNLEILKNIGFDSDDLYNKLGDAVEPMVQAARANVAPYSLAVAASVDTWRKRPSSRPLKKTVMVIVSKKATMIEWVAGRHTTSPRAKMAPGQVVAESFAQMLEIGTSKTWRAGPGRPAHYWFRRAVDETKAKVVGNIMAAVQIMVLMASQQFDKKPE